MTEFRFIVTNRSYDNWSIFDNNTLSIQDNNLFFLNPYENKLLNDDVFIVSKDEVMKVNIIYSVNRISKNIPCILVLEGNKTYGRHNKSKLLYKCIPDDARLPIFLVPYELKTNFSKSYINKYVTINFTHWENKHPQGSISQIIGDVNILPNIYEYQLYCKSLNFSIQSFQKKAHDLISKFPTNENLIYEIIAKYPSIENRTHLNVFTIDGPTTTDYDDAFSTQLMEDGSKIVSIYISNVCIVMDYLNLWNSFSNRISTIYLPDKKRPMLPTILSDNLCSLQCGNNRIVLTLDIYLNENNDILKINYLNSLICVFKNYVYDEEELINNIEYIKLFNIVSRMSRKYKYLNNVNNSYDLVAYLMIFMNYYTAIELFKYKNGIFRTNTITSLLKIENMEEIDIPDDVKNYIKIWNSSKSQYVLLTNDKELLINHDSLKIEAYIHITSPIRRLVDLLNIIKLQENLGLFPTSCDSSIFYNNWSLQIDYINKTMKNIRKVQNDCNLIMMCMNDESIYNKIYNGYCFDKICRSNGLFQYMIYIPEIKITSKIVSRIEMDEYTRSNYKLFLFNDEDNLKKKIKIQLM